MNVQKGKLHLKKPWVRKAKLLLILIVLALGIGWLVSSVAGESVYYLVGCLVLLVVGAVAVPTVIRISREGKASSKDKARPANNAGGVDRSQKSSSGFNIGGLVKGALAVLALYVVFFWIIPAGWNAFMDWSPAGSSHRVATPSAGQPANEAGGTECQAWARNHQNCLLTERTTIMLPPGTPAGQSFCWSPAANAFASIRVILPDGSLRNFDSSNLGLQVVGYEFTPVQGRETNLDYWLAPGQCTPA